MIDSVPFPLVTVVTPSYNQGQFIEETILSVLNQDYPNIEYLVIDGGSTDGTIDILRTYEDRLTWISEPDSGQSHAINKGFRKARGGILCWLNSDDTFVAGAVRRAVEHMVDNDQVMMVYGEGNLMDEHGAFLSLFPYTRPFDLWALINQLDYILQPTVFLRAETLQEVGYVDENLHWCMDWDLWIRIGSRFQVDYIPQCLANARVYSENKTAQGGYRRALEIAAVLRRHCDRILMPAYIIYVGGTISTVLQARSARWYGFMRWFLYPLRAALWAFVSNAQGFYQDGWLGRKAQFMFATKLPATAIRFSLDMPDDDRLVPNSVTIAVNGQSLQPQKISSAGPCEVTVPYDPSCQLPTEVTFHFQRALQYDRKLRRLVCRLQQVEMSTVNVQDNVAIAKTVQSEAVDSTLKQIAADSILAIEKRVLSS